MNFTFQQKLAMAMGFLGAATSAFGALNPIMSPKEALIGTVIFGFISACLGVMSTIVSGQGAQMKAVAAMPGVERIQINAQANQVAAQLATSGALDAAKIESLPEAAAQVAQTAKGT